MSEINYRQQWAEGEIEAGTLLDAIDTLAQRCLELERRSNNLFNSYSETCADVAHMKNERDTLRAEVEALRKDRKACFEEFKALRRSADETERELRSENVRLAGWYSEAGTREDALRAEVERLSHALRRIHARAEDCASDGRGISEDSTLVIEWIARKALEAGECVHITGSTPEA